MSVQDGNSWLRKEPSWCALVKSGPLMYIKEVKFLYRLYIYIYIYIYIYCFLQKLC
jgi:hypothetical protein